jgi:succinoglycan biosynthesis transport protein ExoP
MTAAALPMLRAHPTYVGKSALVLSSMERNAEQDAMMATGYVSLFNEPSTIARLRATQRMPADVTFEARTVAASPIITIEATAADPAVAQDAAQNMAEAFRNDVNLVRQRATEAAIANLEGQIDQLRAQPGPDGAMNPLVPILVDRVEAMRSDSTNQLQNLQLRDGVSKVELGAMRHLALGAAAGLLLGILAALGLAASSTRLANSADVLDKTGIEPLVEVPNAGSRQRNRLRKDRLRTLANIVSLQDLPKSTVVAVTDCRGARGARDLAEALASLSAQQGYRTVLVYADNDASQHTQGAGFNDLLADSSLVDSLLKETPVDSLKIVPSGSVVADRYSLMSRDKIAAVFDELRRDADTIVIAAPSIAESIDSQPVCTAADLNILVIGRRSSRASDVTSAVDALANAHAVLLGAVLMDGAERR